MKFYAELYNSNGELVGVSQVVLYADLVNGQYVYQEMSSSGMSSPYLFMGHVPEPTGGVLVLFGLGLLALGRRGSRG